MEEKSCLEELKETYAEIQKEYNLPSFEELNKNFGIEKIAETETDYLLREIRKFVADKILNYFRFIESILNPSNSSMFIFSIIKAIDLEEKEILKKAYVKLAKNEVHLIEIDMEFSEEKEAEYIRESYKTWQKVKADILKTVSKIKKNWDNKFEVNGRSYFG